MTVTQQNKYCGVDRWHKAGITGKGVVVWNMENGKATHGKQTTQRILHSAPDAPAVYKDVYVVGLAQKTYLEKQIEMLQQLLQH